MALVASSTSSFEGVVFPRNVRHYSADFSSLDEVERLAAVLYREHPSLDLLINNCGVYREAPFFTASRRDIDSVIDVNVKALMLLTERLLAPLKKGRTPLIVNISSIQAKCPSGNQAIYAASKAAVTAFSDSLRQELNKDGIRVTVLHPAGVNTWGGEGAGLLEAQDVAQVVTSCLDLRSAVQLHEVTMSGLYS